MTRVPAILRIVIGLLFVVSGGHKLLAPAQQFVAIVDAYAVVPSSLTVVVATVVPWCELLLGTLLLVGLHIPFAVRAVMVLLGAFMIVVIQALARGLEIGECGCFGSQLSLPLPAVLVVDALLLAGLVLLIRFPERAAGGSFDTSSLYTASVEPSEGQELQ